MNINFNLQSVHGFLKDLYTFQIEKVFGTVGSEKLKSLLNQINIFYTHVPAEKITGSLTILIGVEQGDIAPVINDLGSSIVQKTIFNLVDNVKDNVSNHIVIELLENDEYLLFVSKTQIDYAKLADLAIVYTFTNSTDNIYAKSYHCQIPKLSPVLASNFCIPTLNGLEDALLLYNNKVARNSCCPTLSSIWEGGVEGPRLVLVNRPESLMRDSLTNALRLLLAPDAEVRPEHNTDETKPVDIKVSWIGSRATALIEIKWLGRSVAKPRSNGAKKTTYTNYALPRVQEGALQLADYLDREVRNSTATAHKGYLVIFDARRRNVKGANDFLSVDDAFHYENDVLRLDVDYPGTRDDYSSPYKFFMIPKRSLTT